MLNRVDFFQSEQTQLSLPATTPLVFLEGSLCPYLEVKEIVRENYPQFSYARLEYNPAAYSHADNGNIESELALGKPICIKQLFNSGTPDVSIFGLCVFAGQIEAIEKKLSSNGEKLEIIAKDFSAVLQRITVFGRWLVGFDGSIVFLDSFDTVFNEDTKPNAASCGSRTLFCAQASQAGFWSYAEVIRYLLSENLTQSQLHIPTIEQLEELTGNRIARDLDVTGLNLLDALHRCCDDAGLKFKFIPRNAPTGPKQAIVFFKNTTGRIIELDLQSAGEKFSVSKTNIAEFSRKNFYPVTHKYIGQGDFKIFEATFNLIKAWDPEKETANYFDFSPSTNPNFYQVKDVFRKWCLNETGTYSASPYNQGDAFDFSRIFETKNFAQRRRRFLPALTTDSQNKSIGYYLEVSYDNGLHWWQYLHAFNSLLDQCGIWLSSEQLDIDTWIAALKGTLKFRITASVASDERISCFLADGPVNSVIPVVEHIFTLPRRFKYRKVSAQSIFANLSGSFGKPDEADDSLALYDFVRSKAQTSAEVIETIDLQTPYLALDYQLGDAVTVSPESVDLFSTRSDNRSESIIEYVQMNFQKQCTNLKIIRRRRPQI